MRSDNTWHLNTTLALPGGHNLGEAALGMVRDIRIPAASFRPEMVGSVVDIPLSFSLDADAADMPTGKP